MAEQAVPRRAQMDQWTEAERAIYDAAQAVERAGASPHLTDAVVLLREAREAVADHIDQVGFALGRAVVREPR